MPFTGTRDLRLADAGHGTAEDLARTDVRGRLALLATGKTVAEGTQCGLDIDRVRAVHAAGAVGVIAYPAPDSACPVEVAVPLRISQQRLTGESRPIGIPNVSLPTAEGVALRHELTVKPVVIRTAATPETPYTYVLKPYEEGRIPKSLRYTMTDRNLGELQLDHHATQPTQLREYQYLGKTDDAVAYALPVAAQTSAFAGPHSYTEYFGPVSGEVVRFRGSWGRPGNGADAYRKRTFRTSAATLFDKPEQDREQWHTIPRTPGVIAVPDELHRLIGPAKPRRGVGTCQLCREGNLLWAAFQMTTGAPGGQQVDSGTGLTISPEEGTTDFTVRLFNGEQEIPRVPAPWPVFNLATEPTTYTMTAQSRWTDVDWTFRSAAPTQTSRRPGYDCLLETISGSTTPCAPLPMVFAGYDMGRSLSMTNTASDRVPQRFSVHAYHSDSTTAMPAIAGLKLWVSYDHGARWKPVDARGLGGGNYAVTVNHPPERKRPSDTVSLKVEAWDAAGNRIEQVSRDVYRLTS